MADDQSSDQIQRLLQQQQQQQQGQEQGQQPVQQRPQPRLFHYGPRSTLPRQPVGNVQQQPLDPSNSLLTDLFASGMSGSNPSHATLSRHRSSHNPSNARITPYPPNFNIIPPTLPRRGDSNSLLPSDDILRAAAAGAGLDYDADIGSDGGSPGSVSGSPLAQLAGAGSLGSLGSLGSRLLVPMRSGARRSNNGSPTSLGLSDLELSEGNSEDGYLSASSSLYSIHHLNSPLIHAIPSPLASPLMSLEEMQAQFFAGLPGLSQAPSLTNFAAMTDEDLEEILLQSMSETNMFFAPPAAPLFSSPSEADILASLSSIPPSFPSMNTTPTSSLSLEELQRQNELLIQQNLALAAATSPMAFNPPQPIAAVTLPASLPIAQSPVFGNSSVKIDPGEAEEPTEMDEGAEDKEGDGDGKHEKPALYQCPFPDCGKRFTRPYNLKSHYRSHTGERPYQCNSCTMNFCRRHDLKRHEKLHGGGKPHVCLACGKSFARLDALKRHLRSSDVSKSTCSQKVRLLQLSAKVFPGAGGVGDPGGSSSSDGLS